MLNVVWFKRDLRIHDHQALVNAAADGPVMPLYVFEPEYWQQPDTSLRQWQFVRECLLDLNQTLEQRYQMPLIFVSGDVVDILEKIHQIYGPFKLHSHEETGNLWTFERDKRVKKWCKSRTIVWQEFAQQGVRRPNPTRDIWAKHWLQFMQQPKVKAPDQLTSYQLIALNNNVSTRLLPLQTSQWPTTAGADLTPCPERQIGGRTQAVALFKSFIKQRSEYYRGSISSPNSAEQACSRLSPYIAMGCLSMRELVQVVQQQKSKAPTKRWQQSLNAFESRLWWHCHFIQKLEDEPSIQWQSLHSSYGDIRDNFDPTYLQAWKDGKTGWPLVDACMRYLKHHGWLNFRMRAMLMSIASYPLWLPWQQSAQHLARYFTDYEPGIHYPQAQMQAGTTGINIPRMYNPTTQAETQDPDGVFIRRWIPELANVETPWIHQPWLMNHAMQEKAGITIGVDYPYPLVEFNTAIRLAKSKMTAAKQESAGTKSSYKDQAQSIAIKHGSRKASSNATSKRQTASKRSRAKVDKTQLSLF